MNTEDERSLLEEMIRREALLMDLYDRSTEPQSDRDRGATASRLLVMLRRYEAVGGDKMRVLASAG